MALLPLTAALTFGDAEFWTSSGARPCAMDFSGCCAPGRRGSFEFEGVLLALLASGRTPAMELVMMTVRRARVAVRWLHLPKKDVGFLKA